MNGGKNMGAVKKVMKKVLSKVVGTPKVVAPQPELTPEQETESQKFDRLVGDMAKTAQPAAAAAPVAKAMPTATAADPKAAEPTAAETQVALKKTGKKKLNKTGPKGILGDATLYTPTLLG